MIYLSRRCTRLTFVSLLTLASLSVPAGMPLAADGPGLEYEQSLQTRSQSLFGFGQPVAESANTPSSTAPGDQAVEVAANLQVRVNSSTVGEDADMIALWPDDTNPTHAIICNEIDGTTPGSPASVQRVRLSDGQVEDMVLGLESCDPARRTAWGTIVVGEEAGPAGRLWEILDPLNVNGVTVDRTAGTSSDPDHVVARTALGQLSFEGIVLLADGTTYYGDELRPSNGKPGGGIYKFVPNSPSEGGTISDLDQSPLVAGSVYVMRLGLRNGGTDFGQGTNTGAGKWIGPLSTTTDLATSALAAGGYTGYYRPEDMERDPIAFERGVLRVCWANTGNDTFSQWGEVLCMQDEPTSEEGFNTGTRPVVTPFIIGNPHLRMPDNLAFQPHTGILYVLMDATTSAEDPAFTNDDVWACLPDGADSDTLSDGCVRVMTLKDGEAEFTGIQFFADGQRFLIHTQHRTQEGRAVPQTTDQLLVSGLHIPGEGMQAPDLLETYVSPPLDQPAPVLQRGGSLAIQDYVQNSGATPAGDSRTQFYLSLNPVKESGDVLLGGRAVASLAPGSSLSGNITVTVPQTTPAGTYFVLACADDSDTVSESNELNNCRASGILVEVK